MAQNDATRRQIEAARPDRSTWLSANAGSGKTKVLTDRVARLLLEGVNPQNILCLTYTKAAASEMQNRLFDRLGKWAMKPNEELRQQLEQLGAGDVITDDALAQARRLFASAIETPGGLKIQTIHSFCSAVLRRFPFEAGITPNFSEMEERAAALLRGEIVEEIGRGEDAGALEALAIHFRGAELTDLTDEIARMGVLAFDSFDLNALRRELGLPDDLTVDSLLSRTFEAGDADLLAQVTDLLAQGSANDVKAADKLRAVQQLDQSALSILEGVFLYGAKANAGPFSAKDRKSVV